MNFANRYTSKNIDTMIIPKNSFIEIDFGEEKESYFTHYLYNISDYFKLMIDNNEIPKFDKSFKNIIKYLSLNVSFSIENNDLIEFLKFSDYINCRMIFRQIYNGYSQKVLTLFADEIMPILFNYISKEEKQDLFIKLDNNNFSNISSNDLKILLLNNSVSDFKLIFELLSRTDIQLTNDEKTILKSKTETKKYNNYILLKHNDNPDYLYLEETINTKVGILKSVTKLNRESDILFTSTDYYNFKERPNALKEPTQVTKEIYRNTLKVLYKTNNLHLIPIIDSCIDNQNIKII